MKNASEHAHQVTLINWFESNYPQYKGRLFTVPNGGLRNKSVAAKLKAEGLRPGVPDLFLPVASNGYHGLFIEMKSEKGRASPHQLDWIEYLNGAGYKAVVCNGWLAAAEVLREYL